jgi:hypothetical protein
MAMLKRRVRGLERSVERRVGRSVEGRWRRMERWRRFVAVHRINHRKGSADGRTMLLERQMRRRKLLSILLLLLLLLLLEHIRWVLLRSRSATAPVRVVEPL